MASTHASRQALFTERLLPIAFWYFSLAGGMTLFAYAVHRLDPVFITGQSLGLLVYTRNLLLISREKRASAAPM
jgi:lipid-A-disaccharide synthase-like uncharacterized protein